MKERRDVGEQLTATDLRGRTLLWKMTRGLTPKSDLKAFEGILFHIPDLNNLSLNQIIAEILRMFGIFVGLWV